MGNNSSNTLIGILAGTAIGATLGILFAPDKGVNTRHRIAEETTAAKDRLATGAIHLKDRVVETVAAKRGTIEEQVEHMVSDVSYKTEDVITALEKKLSQLKDKNKKFQQSPSQS